MEQREIEVTCKIKVSRLSNLIADIKTEEDRLNINYKTEINKIRLLKTCFSETIWKGIWKFELSRLNILLQNAKILKMTGRSDEKNESEELFLLLINNLYTTELIPNWKYFEWDIENGEDVNGI